MKYIDSFSFCDIYYLLQSFPTLQMSTTNEVQILENLALGECVVEERKEVVKNVFKERSLRLERSAESQVVAADHLDGDAELPHPAPLQGLQGGGVSTGPALQPPQLRALTDLGLVHELGGLRLRL